jgi:hypothetical protein
MPAIKSLFFILFMQTGFATVLELRVQESSKFFAYAIQILMVPSSVRKNYEKYAISNYIAWRNLIYGRLKFLNSLRTYIWSQQIVNHLEQPACTLWFWI